MADVSSILSNGVNGNAQRPRNPQLPQLNNIISEAIPGFNGLTESATSMIRNLMSGQPSSGPTKRANAYYGANSGMPGSDFVNHRGFDLYNEKADQYSQRGFQDLLSLFSNYAGKAFPDAGQLMQNDQFNATLETNQDNLSKQRYQANKKPKPNTAMHVAGNYPYYTGIGIGA